MVSIARPRLLVVGTGVALLAAAAAAWPSPDSGRDAGHPARLFRGFDRATMTYTFWSATHDIEYTIGCLHQTYSGLVSIHPTRTVSIDIEPSDCSVSVDGVAHHVTPSSCSGGWRATIVSSSTDTAFLNIRSCHGLAFHLDAWEGCWVAYGQVGAGGSAVMYDRDLADTRTIPSTSRVRKAVRLQWRGLVLPYRSTCHSVEARGRGRSSAEGFISGLWHG